MPVQSIEQFYSKLSEREEGSVDYSKALLLLHVRSRFYSLFSYDPVTGDALHSNLDELLDRFNLLSFSSDSKDQIKDRLSLIAEYVEPALSHLFDELRSIVRRQHTMLPVYAVRHTDAKTVRWLSTRPGRTVREKLAGKQRMLAVQHTSSIDTVENRLVKSFVQILAHLLRLREESIQPSPWLSSLLSRMERWLASDTAQSISPWNNLPPNNTLLSDQNYRRVWKSWCRLQSIDTDVAADFRSLPNDCMRLLFWALAAGLQRDPAVRFIQQPLFPGYDALTIDSAISNSDASTTLTGFWKKNKRYESIELELNNNNVAAVSLPNAKIDIPESMFVDQLPPTVEFILGLARKILTKYGFNKPLATAELSSSHHPIEATDVFLDLTGIQPRYALDRKTAHNADRVPYRLIWQVWKNRKGSDPFQLLPLDCSNAAAMETTVSSHNQYDIHTCTIHDVIQGDNSGEAETVISAASNFFSSSLSSSFPDCKRCVYLIPDSGDDFSLETLRRSMNLRFTGAEPLPRSIAKVFHWQAIGDFKKRSIKDGDMVLVIDAARTGTTVTPVYAKYSELVHSELPKTNGITWERHPPYVFSVESEIESMGPDFLQYFTEDDIDVTESQLSLARNPGKAIHLDGPTLGLFKSHSFQNEVKQLIGTYAKQQKKNNGNIVWLNTDPRKNLLSGAQALYFLQASTEVPLWRDHLPELKMEHAAGAKLFSLVGRNTSIEPKRGKSVKIPISQEFELPAEKDFFEFKLVQGDGRKKQQYYAYLHHSALPLAHVVRCKLYLTYTYGADIPYDLRFYPAGSVEAGFPYIRVVWNRQSKRNWLDLPAPQFPEREPWNALRTWPGKEEDTENDIIDWLSKTFSVIENVRKHGWKKYTICPPFVNRAGRTMYFIEGHDKKAAVFQNRIIQRSENDEVKYAGNEEVYAYIEEDSTGRLSARDVTQNPDPDTCFLTKRLRFPSLTAWKKGRSLQDSDVPEAFRLLAAKAIQNAECVLNDNQYPTVMRKEMFRFLAYVHKDAPPGFVEIITRQINKNNLQDVRDEVGFSIGAATLEWQSDWFYEVVRKIAEDDGDANNSLYVLSIAFWREESLVYKLGIDEVRIVLRGILKNLTGIIHREAIKYQDEVYTVTCLEVLLAVLRLRNTGSQDMRKMLSPKYGTEMQGIIEKLRELGTISRKLSWKLSTKIQFSHVDGRPARGSDPELLRVAIQYATGSEESNNIKILNIMDSEE